MFNFLDAFLCVYFHWNTHKRTLFYLLHKFGDSAIFLLQYTHYINELNSFFFFLSDIILLWNRFDIEKNEKTTQIKGNTAMDRRCEPFYYYEQNNARFLFFWIEHFIRRKSEMLIFIAICIHCWI